MTYQSKPLKRDSMIESRAIEFIPPAERHGTVFSQFTLWLGVNLNVTAVVIGSLAVVAGSSIVWAAIGLLIGQLVGASIIALHAVQGPKLGLPQMIMTRAQFGIKGTVVPLTVVFCMCVGLSASGCILAGQSLGALFNLSTRNGILLFGILAAILTVLGYKTIHRIAKVASLVGALAFVYMFISLFMRQDITPVLSNSSFHFASFLLAISLSASWQISFGPFVADYSRYLPESTSGKKVFWATLLGAVIGGQASMTFGVFAASLAGEQFAGHEMNYIVGLSSVGLIAMLLYFSVSIGKLMAIAMNSYTSAMSLVTLFDMGGNHASKKSQRIVFSIISVISAIVIALWGQHSFLSSFSSFILLLLTFMTPWSAINLVEFYSYKESYDAQRQQLVDHAGAHRGINGYIVALYIVSVVIQMPFIATSIYTGPLVSYLHGADISWLIGLIFPAVVLLLRRKLQQGVQSPKAADE